MSFSLAEIAVISFSNIVNGWMPEVLVVCSHRQQFFSELPSPGRSHYTNYRSMNHTQIYRLLCHLKEATAVPIFA